MADVPVIVRWVFRYSRDIAAHALGSPHRLLRMLGSPPRRRLAHLVSCPSDGDDDTDRVPAIKGAIGAPLPPRGRHDASTVCAGQSLANDVPVALPSPHGRTI